MVERFNEEELKRIILWMSEAPDFGIQYDNLPQRPFKRYSEVVDEHEVERSLSVAQQRIRQLREAWADNVRISPNYSSWTSVAISYHLAVPREEYINEQLRIWRQSSNQHNYKEYLFRSLGLRNASSIRNIYIKLLLEHKIDTEDFKDLVQSRDVEVNLIGLCWGQVGNLQNYFI